MMKYLKNERGQSLVEFALILPLILLILMGILEFGILLNSYLSINHASKEGARLGALGGTDAEIFAEILNTLPTLDAPNITITINPSQQSRTRGEVVVVTVTYNYPVTLPVIGRIINNVVNLEAQTSMRVE